MFENSNLLKTFFSLIMLFIFVLRLLTIKANKKAEKIPGKIYAAWTHKALFLIYIAIFFGTFIEFVFFKKTVNLVLSIFGLILCLYGFSARKWATNTLGKYWSNNVEIRNTHPVIKEGPYKYMRHPNYLFLSMEFFGLTIFGNAWWTMIFLVCVFIPVIVSRMIVEEKKMIEQTGTVYLDYKKEVPAFFPFKFKRK